MEFSAFADRAAAIEETAADGETIARVADLLDGSGEDLPTAARFVQGRVFPAWSERTLDVGPAFCHEAIARAAGPNVAADDVERRLAEEGEIGAVAAGFDLGAQQGLGAFRAGGTDDALILEDVYSALESVATTAGAGSREERLRVLFGLFTRCSSVEARYLARLVLGEMRIGVGEGTVRDAIASAFLEDSATADRRVERALQVTNDCGRVATVARDDGLDGLAALRLEVGRPVQAMLAQTGTAADALAAWDAAGVERKFDGARVQAHHDGTATRLFSRNLEEVTAALPEIVDAFDDRLDAPAILDGEVVAVDDAGAPRPFQDVLRRFRREHDVERALEETPLVCYAFDCLHVDGDDLLDAPLVDRHRRLETVLGEPARGAARTAGVDADPANRLFVAELTLTADSEEIGAIEAASLEAGHEGVLLKDPESTYSPGRRGREWLKRKPDVETLDLVVTGAEWGEGRRASVLGTFYLGAPAGPPGEFAAVGNVATGVTDDELAALTERLEPLITETDGQTVSIAPQVVVEVGYEEIQRSPTYSSGYALRFPRFVGVREDLDPSDADGLDRIERLASGE